MLKRLCPAGREHLRLLVASIAKDDVVFVQLRIQPEALMKLVDRQKLDHHI